MASFLIWPLVGSAVLLPLVQLENHQVKLPDKCNDFAAGTKFINLGAMFPMNGSWDGGVACYPAAQLALAHLNCHPSRSLVDGYKLKLQVTDTYVSICAAQNVCYDQIKKDFFSRKDNY